MSDYAPPKYDRIGMANVVGKAVNSGLTNSFHYYSAYSDLVRLAIDKWCPIITRQLARSFLEDMAIEGVKAKLLK